MTLQQAIAQRDAILTSMGVSRAEFQQRSVEYSSGSDRLKELAYLEDLITQLTDQENGNVRSSRCTYATHRRD